jgi:hypothetical protein
MGKAQVSLEALVVFAAFIAAISLFLQYEKSVASSLSERVDALEARVEAERFAFVANFFALDGENARMQLRLRNATKIFGEGGRISSAKGKALASAQSLASVDVADADADGSIDALLVGSR